MNIDNITFDDMKPINTQLSINIQSTQKKIVNKKNKPEIQTLIKTNNNEKTIEITNEFIESGRTGAGGFKYYQLQLLGVETPPKSGWKRKIIGTKISKENAEKFLALKGKMRKAEQREILKTGKNPLLIEITESEKNIIRFCVEESHKRNLERGEHETRAEITKRILDKLLSIKKKEENQGTFSKSYFF